MRATRSTSFVARGTPRAEDASEPTTVNGTFRSWSASANCFRGFTSALRKVPRHRLCGTILRLNRFEAVGGKSRVRSRAEICVEDLLRPAVVRFEKATRRTLFSAPEPSADEHPDTRPTLQDWYLAVACSNVPRTTSAGSSKESICGLITEDPVGSRKGECLATPCVTAMISIGFRSGR
jgi:hypothetical protein